MPGDTETSPSPLSRLMEVLAEETGGVINLHDVSSITLRVPDLRLKPNQSLHHGAYCRFAKYHAHNVTCSKNKERSVAIARARQRPFAGHCPFGIWELAVPVLYEGTLLAVLYVGHFRTSQHLANINGVSYGGPLPTRLTAPLKRRIRLAATTLAHTIEAMVSNWHRCGGSLQAAHPPEFYRDATIRYIDTHFSQPVCLGDYAAQLGLHPNHLGKTIRRTFGRGFLDLLRDRRLEEARLLLRITDQPVTQIAFSCGFTDSNYFSTVFRQHAGMAPRNYRDLEARKARSQPRS